MYTFFRSLAVTLAVWVTASAATAAVPVVTNSGDAAGSVGYNFTYSIFATESPTAYGIDGLPAGVTIDGTTGRVTGAPQTTGTYPLTLWASNADGRGTAKITLVVDAGPSEAPVILNAPIFESSYYRYTYAAYPSLSIDASNRPQSYGASGLPVGAVLDATRGRIFYNDAAAGLYTVTLTATNPVGTGSAQLRWAVHPVIYGVVPDKRAYQAGETIQLNVSFNAPVVVSGSPMIPLASMTWSSSSAPTRMARYVGGSGTAVLTFAYVTSAADFAPEDVYIGEPLLNGGSIAHASGVAAYLNYPSLIIGERPRTLTISGPPVITSPTSAAATVATAFNYTITAANRPTGFAATGLPSGLVLDRVTGVISGTPTTAGTFLVTLQAFNNYTVDAGTAQLTLTIADTATGRPVFVTQPASQTASVGGRATFSAGTNTPDATYQWTFNGAPIAGATASTYTVENAQPASAGIYAVTATANGQSSVSAAAILGIASSAKVLGAGAEIGTDIVHANGNVYDQVALQGNAVTVTADRGQVTRVSFIDLSDDIVQVEFGGAGTLTIALDVPTGPAAATLYQQPGVSYMRGHARLVVAGADESTNLSVFSVGRITAVNQALFRSDVVYDGVADIALIAIQSSNGKFGGVRAANANLWATAGLTGIYAPAIQFTGPAYVCEVTATENAMPVLMFGAAADTRITGGDLAQTNGRAVQVSGLNQLKFVAGITSHGQTLPALANRARLEDNGRDVTAQVVVNPN
jgi:hypothetical protein